MAYHLYSIKLCPIIRINPKQVMYPIQECLIRNFSCIYWYLMIILLTQLILEKFRNMKYSHKFQHGKRTYWLQPQLLCCLCCYGDFNILNSEILFAIFHNILFMGRKQKKCAKKCEKHLLHLRPFHSMAYLSRDVQVSFCPTSLQKKTNYPSFNKDRKHYTPAFCLEDDQVYFILLLA